MRSALAPVLVGTCLVVPAALGCGRVAYVSPDAPDASASIDAPLDVPVPLDTPGMDAPALGEPDAFAHDARGLDALTADAPPLPDAFAEDDAPAPDAFADDAAIEPDAAPAVAPLNIIFLSPVVPSADLGGLAGADAICAAAAREGGFGGTFVAYLSTSTVNAIDRLGTAQGWVRPDGRVFARTQSELVERGSIDYPPSLDHLGERNPAGPSNALTGSDLNGQLVPGQACADWTSASGFGTGGTWDLPSWDWHARHGVSCSAPARLYCMQIDHASPPPTPAPLTGRRIFAAYRPDAAETPDAACARVGASLPGTYHALVAFPGAPAASRFVFDRWPIVSTRGLLVAESMSDLTADGLWSSVRQVDGSSATFSMLASGSSGGLAGSPTSTCLGWTSSSSADSAAVGLVGATAQTWFGTSSAGCNNAMWFYCLED